MNRNDTFPVPIRGHADPVIQALMIEQGGPAAYGRWHILLGMLYDMDGIIEDTPTNRSILAANLQCTQDELDAFIGACLELGLLDPGMYAKGHVMNAGVCKQLAYIEACAAGGSKGGKSKKGTLKGKD